MKDVKKTCCNIYSRSHSRSMSSSEMCQTVLRRHQTDRHICQYVDILTKYSRVGPHPSSNLAFILISTTQSVLTESCTVVMLLRWQKSGYRHLAMYSESLGPRWTRCLQEHVFVRTAHIHTHTHTHEVKTIQAACCLGR